MKLRHKTSIIILQLSLTYLQFPFLVYSIILHQLGTCFNSRMLVCMTILIRYTHLHINLRIYILTFYIYHFIYLNTYIKIRFPFATCQIAIILKNLIPPYNLKQLMQFKLTFKFS